MLSPIVHQDILPNETLFIKVYSFRRFNMRHFYRYRVISIAKIAKTIFPVLLLFLQHHHEDGKRTRIPCSAEALDVLLVEDYKQPGVLPSSQFYDEDRSFDAAEYNKVATRTSDAEHVPLQERALSKAPLASAQKGIKNQMKTSSSNELLKQTERALMGKNGTPGRTAIEDDTVPNDTAHNRSEEDIMWTMFAEIRHSTKMISIAGSTSGSISFVASVALVAVILRSYTGMGSSYHRLLIGLSCCDILSSFSHVIGPVVVPTDLAYMVWNARGSMTSCTLSAFFVVFSMHAGTLYNWALCFFYLVVIRYEKNDEYIRSKIEPFLHAFAIMYPFAMAVTALLMNGYHPALSFCYVRDEYNPPHCHGYETGEIPPGFKIPCGRGGNGAYLPFAVLSLSINLMTPFVFIATVRMCYLKVLQNEKKMSRYGISALRKNAAKSSRLALEEGITTLDGEKKKSGKKQNKISSIIARMPSFVRKSSSSSVQKSASLLGGLGARHKSRSIFYRAVWYVMAYVICSVLVVILTIIQTTGVEVDDKVLSSIYFASAIVHPLQGFFNFLIFLYPKVMSQKRNKKKNLNWVGAFIKALTSRGIRERNRSSTNRSIGSRKTTVPISRRISGSTYRSGSIGINHKSLLRNQGPQRDVSRNEEEKAGDNEFEQPKHQNTHSVANSTGNSLNISIRPSFIDNDFESSVGSSMHCSTGSLSTSRKSYLADVDNESVRTLLEPIVSLNGDRNPKEECEPAELE